MIAFSPDCLAAQLRLAATMESLFVDKTSKKGHTIFKMTIKKETNASINA